ncbi:MAG: hypothetical protein HQL56_10660 [Magnetococcales bacterium]|nr:hypothetical protein [Magnetococcales bacterium]
MDTLDLATWKLPPGTPTLWVRRVVLFTSLKPIAIIRDIPLRQGLNIIWASERASDGAFGGHDAGKTTLCRLIRYCLGEPTFSTKVNQEAIRTRFPHGQVAAEIQLEDRFWSVLRPFRSGGKSLAGPDATIESLLSDDGVAQSFDLFLQQLESTLLRGLVVNHFPKTGDPILPGHLLAWLARDQEAHFRRFYKWREADSESGSPHLQRPKEDAIFLFRNALGLLIPDEADLENKLQQARGQLKRTEREIEERRIKPKIMVQELMRQLHTLSGLPEDGPTLPYTSDDLYVDTLKMRIEERIGTLRKDLQGLAAERTQRQREHDLALADLGVVRNKIEELTADKKMLEQYATEVQPDGRQTKDLHNQWADRTCTPVKMPIAKCSHFQDMVQRERETINLASIGKQRWSEKARDDSIGIIKQYEVQLEALTVERDQVQDRVDQLKKKDQEAEERTRILGQQLQRLEDARTKYEQWSATHDQGDNDEYLSSLLAKKTGLEGAMRSHESALSNKTIGSHEAWNQLESLFRNLRHAIHPGLDRVRGGRTDGLSDVIEEKVRSGEAMTSLVVILVDIAAMIYSIREGKALPGFLLHDSPRVADLSSAIYSNLFKFMVILQDQFTPFFDIPYQYIVTTTTAPHEEVQQKGLVCLELNSGIPDCLLLKKRFIDDSGYLFGEKVLL